MTYDETGLSERRSGPHFANPDSTSDQDWSLNGPETHMYFD